MILQQRHINLTTYSVLGLATVGAFLMPSSLGTIQSAYASGGGSGVELTATVRDFSMSHPDFDVTPSHGFAHYAGNVETSLDGDGMPGFTGVLEGEAITDFEIDGAEVIPGDDFAIKVTVLGASITYSGHYDVPVTVEVRVDNDVFEPFGDFGSPTDGTVNDEHNPRADVNPAVFQSGSDVRTRATAWVKKYSWYSGNSDWHWRAYKTVDSASVAGDVITLRDGDPIPNISGFDGQSSATDYVTDYVDWDTETMMLGDNQVIQLFEFTKNGSNAVDADFQDLVLLVTLGSDPEFLDRTDVFGQADPTMNAEGYRVASQWRDADGNSIAPHMANANGVTSDTMGSAGETSTGGITDNSTFSQWFDDVPGENQSGPATIELAHMGDGLYEFASDHFFPIDGMLLGNEGLANNSGFTLDMTIDCDYSAGAGQFLEVRTSDDIWVFIDGELVIDLGGVLHGQDQRVDLDRLGLSDGNSYDIRVFMAQRNSMESIFEMRTNIFLRETQIAKAYSAVFD